MYSLKKFIEEYLDCRNLFPEFEFQIHKFGYMGLQYARFPIRHLKRYIDNIKYFYQVYRQA